MIAPFDLRRATSLDEALELLATGDAHVLAGGTALVLLMKQGLLRPGRLVSVAAVAELGGIERLADGSLRIGATVTHRAAERSALVREHAPALADALAQVATVRIRGQATLGGSLAHADPAQDPPPMLIALGASAVIAGPAGRRSVPLDELFVDVFETRIAPGEILREIVVPPLAPGARATYEKFLPRTEDDYATVAVGAMIRLGPDGRCEEARIALGAVGPTPIRVRRTEDALRGEVPTPERVHEAALLVREDVDPIADARGSVEYKREMAVVWTERAIRRIAGSTRRVPPGGSKDRGAHG